MQSGQAHGGGRAPTEDHFRQQGEGDPPRVACTRTPVAAEARGCARWRVKSPERGGRESREAAEQAVKARGVGLAARSDGGRLESLFVVW